MAEANYPSVRLRLGDLLGEARDFAADAWRDCWLPMLFVIAGHALTFLNHHVSRAEWSPGLLATFTPLLFLAYIPLYGGLYRAALGGRLFDSLGPGGLQWSSVEWRLIAVGVVILFLIGLVMTPFLAATGVAALVIGLKTTMSAGPLGQWARWAPVALLIWGVFFWLMGSRIARLALGWPYSVARGKTEPFAGMAPARRTGWAIAIAYLICQLPWVLAALAPSLLAMVEPDVLSSELWPLPEALGTGVLQGVLYAGVLTPLSVGVLVGAYFLIEEAHHAAAGDAHSAVDDAALAGAGLAGAAALAAHEAAEVDPAASEAEHGHAPHGDGEATAHTTDDTADAPDSARSDDPAPEQAATEAHEAAVENDDPPPVYADHSPDPALAGLHPQEPSPDTDAAADEAAAAEQAHHTAEDGSGDHVAPHAPAPEPAHQPAETHHAEVDHSALEHAVAAEPELAHEPELVPEPEPELAHEAVPEPVPELHDAPHAHAGGLEPLSSWPHSVLPPWPTGVSTTLARARLGLPPLASESKPAQPVTSDAQRVQEGERAI